MRVNGSLSFGKAIHHCKYIITGKYFSAVMFEIGLHQINCVATRDPGIASALINESQTNFAAFLSSA